MKVETEAKLLTIYVEGGETWPRAGENPNVKGRPSS
jgi:hypothetical protein